jgi:plastocyanin
MPGATAFQIVVAIIGSLTAAVCALAYFRRVALERPPIGTFNTRDLSVLACFIVALPLLYLAIPADVLTAFLVVTFLSALMIALRPLFPARRLWTVIPALLAANIVVTHGMDDTRGGVQLYWVLTSAVVLVAAVGIANLYVQGGLQLRQIAWFTLFLAVYDITFTRVIPLTPLLAVALQGRPLDPSVGFAAGSYNANVGLGDLLVFCLYTIAAYKGYGRRGAVASLAVITVFGAVAPSVTPLLVPGLFGTTAAAFVPIMTLFGPAAFATYVWLSRTAQERTTAQWLRERVPRAPRPAPTPRARAGLLAPTLAVAALALVTLAGSGGSPSTSAAEAAAPTPSPTAGGPATVALRNVAFSPRSITVRTGQKLTWTNRERVPHNVVATAGARFGSTNLLQNQSFSFRATRPGTIQYVCTLHQGMTGTIVVKG